jgi:threonine dehydrogenase-like Zn-dependent dehydrogenase
LRSTPITADALSRGDRELTLIGSSVTRIYMYWDLARFMIDKQLWLQRMITHRFPIEQAAEAFSLFAEGKTGKGVSEFSREKGHGR